MQGNALLVGARLNMTDDPRVEQLARRPRRVAVARRRLELRPQGHRPPLLLPRVADPDARPVRVRREHEAASRTAELLLDHRLFRSTTTGEPIHESWTRLRHPPDWHYNILYALTVLTRMGLGGDPRAGDAVEMLRRRRFRRGGNEMVTLIPPRARRRQPVEAPEVVVDRQHLDAGASPRPARTTARRRRASPRRSPLPASRPAGSAADAEPVVEPLDVVARRRERVRTRSSATIDAAAVGEQPRVDSQHRRRATRCRAAARTAAA